MTLLLPPTGLLFGKKRMVDNSRRDRVGLGLIGLGSGWEQVYREPLMRLQNRLKIRLVYDSVEARSRSIGAELEAEVAESVWQVVNRRTLQGLLVLDSGWCGSGLLELIAFSDKPAFLGTQVLRQLPMGTVAPFTKSEQSQLNGRTSTGNGQLIPDLGFRFTPSSCRLRELIATKLGRPNTVQVACDLAADIGDIAAIIDWCIDLMGNPSDLRISRPIGFMDFGTIEIEVPPDPPSESRAHYGHSGLHGDELDVFHGTGNFRLRLPPYLSLPPLFAPTCSQLRICKPSYNL